MERTQKQRTRRRWSAKCIVARTHIFLPESADPSLNQKPEGKMSEDKKEPSFVVNEDGSLDEKIVKTLLRTHGRKTK